MQNYYQREEEVSFEWSRLAWDQATQCRGKGKKRSQIGKISASEASRAVRSPNFFSFIPRRFSPPFSPDSSPVVPRGAWSQARSRPARGQSHHTGSIVCIST